MTADEKKIERTVRGVVVSNAMDKTIVVKSERLVPHPKYRKFVRRHTKYYAHDESNSARVGDFVQLTLTRPLSKNKRWLLESVIREAPVEAVEGSEQ
jgi:small subunit ribosomal protein S17